MANSAIPVILRVMAERDPGLANLLTAIERELEQMAQSAQRAGVSMRGMDGGLDKASASALQVSRAVKAVDQAADSAKSSVAGVGAAGKEAFAGVAAGAEKAADATQKAEKASAGLLAGLKRVGMQTAGLAAMGNTPGASGVMLSRKVQSPTIPAPTGTKLDQGVSLLNRALEDAEEKYDKTSRRAVEFGQQSGMALLAAGAGVAALAGYAVRAAGEFEQLRAKLETVQHSAVKAGETFEFARELAAKTPFDVRGVVAAAVQLEVYGQRAQDVLPAVADLAAGMGRGIEETSLTVGKAASGSLEGFESLRNEYGISSAKLAQYGAVLTATGGISVATAADLDEARTALLRIIQTNFGGAVERQSKTFQGAMSNAGDSLQNLAAAWGAELIPAVTTGARAFSAVVDTMGAIPGPLRAVGAGATVAGAGVLLLGGGAILATTGLVAMNAQLAAAAPSIAAAGVAARVTSGLLTGMETAATRAGKAMMWMVTTPWGLALTAAAVVAGAGTMAINAYADAQIKAGNAITEESHSIQSTIQDWRRYKDVIEQATGAKLEFNRTPAQTAGDIAEALKGAEPSKVIGSLQASGTDMATLKAELAVLEQVAQTKKKALTDAREAEVQARELLTNAPGSAVRDAAPAAIAAAEAQQKAFEGSLAITLKAIASGRQLLGIWEGFEPPLLRAVEAVKPLENYLKFADKAKDVRTMTAALGETEKVLKNLQAAAADQKLPAYDKVALQARLLVPGISEGDKAMVEAILTLMDEVQDRSQKINEANKKSHDERIKLSDEEFARAQAGRDEDLNATLAHLRQKLAAVRGNAAEETAVLNQIRQAEKSSHEKNLTAYKSGLQRQLQAAMDAADRLASSGEGTSAQVAEGYRGVMQVLADWERAHKRLLDQVPELRKAYADLRKGASEKVQGADDKAQADKLGDLRQGIQDSLAAARNPEQKLEETRSGIDLYQRILRTDKELQKSVEDRKKVQRELNDLRRSEVDLVRQVADRERQSAQQTESLRAQVMDQEIAGLEARKAAGQDVDGKIIVGLKARQAAENAIDKEIAAKRLERYNEAVRLLEMERDAEIAAAEGSVKQIEDIQERSRLKRRMLDEQERQRALSDLDAAVKAVKDAEKAKQDARNAEVNTRKGFDADRPGGQNSPLMSIAETFSYGAGANGGTSIGSRNKSTMLGSQGRAKDSEPAKSETALAAAVDAARKRVEALTPPIDLLGASATTTSGKMDSLATAATSAAAALSAVKGGGGGGGGSDESALPPAPEGTTTDGRRSYAPGTGPAGAKPYPATGGYPTGGTQTGYPGLSSALRMPTPTEMGAISPRVLTQAPVSNVSTTRNETRNTINVTSSPVDPDERALAVAAERVAQKRSARKRLLVGPWR